MILLAMWMMQATPDADLAQGARVFAQSCAVGYCHGTAGAANRGPRLAGRTFGRAYLDKAVREGLSGTAMPGFQASLKEPDLKAVVAYVLSLSDAGPAGAAAAPPFAPSPAPSAFAGPAAAKRGKDLFFDPVRGVRCGVCHAVQEWGVAVGPNPAAKPPVNGAALRNVKTPDVLIAVTREGERFPALVVEQNKTVFRVYDLTAPPPVLRSFLPGEVKLEAGAWSHAVAVGSYTDADLESVADYLRWLASASLDFHGQEFA
ncbi:MAG: cytochrome c [Acidobacteria bacterium]|nr:cytochrome c [Acidobacteriota bacterium]